MPLSQIRILVASPTEKGAAQMARVLSGFPEFDVVGTATDLPRVFRQIEDAPPDFILLSQKFRGCRDSEVLMSLLKEEDIRWLELRNRPSSAQRMDRHRLAGSGLFEIDATTSAPALAQQIRSVCRNLRSPHALATTRRGGASGQHPLASKVVLVGASTGGVDCLLQLLEGYHPGCPPTLIVQHTGPEFISSLITLLNRRCPVPVIAAKDGQDISHGCVAVASEGQAHLQLHPGDQWRCGRLDAAPVSGHRPSVDALFRSALPRAQDVVAVLLTGMGRDGADGLLALRKKGAVTIAQDEATSVVYGMPRVAHELGAVQHVMGIGDIAAVLNGSAILPERSMGGT